MAYTSEIQACMGFYLYQCEVIILGILKERSTKGLISGLTKFEDSKNVLKTADFKDLKSFIEHGTGILYFSFPECPWCQAYIPMLNEVLENSEMRANYYNARNDKQNDRSFYDEIAQLLIDHNKSDDPDIVLYDNDGKPLIYVPLVVFIKNGEIISWNGESNTNDTDVISVKDYWTSEKVKALKDTLTKDALVIKQAQEENAAKGCDNGCSYGS